MVFRGSKGKGGRDWLTNLSFLSRNVAKEWELQTENGKVHQVGTM